MGKPWGQTNWKAVYIICLFDVVPSLMVHCMCTCTLCRCTPVSSIIPNIISSILILAHSQYVWYIWVYGKTHCNLGLMCNTFHIKFAHDQICNAHVCVIQVSMNQHLHIAKLWMGRCASKLNIFSYLHWKSDWLSCVSFQVQLHGCNKVQ